MLILKTVAISAYNGNGMQNRFRLYTYAFANICNFILFVADESVKRALTAVPNDGGAAEEGDYGHLDWRQKCDRLRRLNASLDKERAQLAQIRLQLQLRLEEANNRRAGGHTTAAGKNGEQ